MVEIDGLHFAVVGHDADCGFSLEDLESGLQERIWKAVQLLASVFGGEVLDCRMETEKADDSSESHGTGTKTI